MANIACLVDSTRPAMACLRPFHTLSSSTQEMTDQAPHSTLHMGDLQLPARRDLDPAM